VVAEKKGSGELRLDDDSLSSKSLDVDSGKNSKKSYEMVLNMLPAKKKPQIIQPEEKVSDKKSEKQIQNLDDLVPIRASSFELSGKNTILKLQNKKSSSLTRKAPAG
jgi:hypothetical protein